MAPWGPPATSLHQNIIETAGYIQLGHCAGMYHLTISSFSAGEKNIILISECPRMCNILRYKLECSARVSHQCFILLT